MKKIIMSFAMVAIILSSFSCTRQDEPENKVKKVKSVRERASDVGKFGDKTLTTGLEEKLTGIVDKNDEHARELEEAASE